MDLRHLAADLRHPGDALVALDPQGAFIDADERALVLLGRSVANLRLGSLLDLVHPSDTAAAASLLAPVAGPAQCRQLRLRHADGGWKSIEAVSTRTDEGVIVLMHDVTDRQRRIAELRRLTEAISDLDRRQPRTADARGARDSLTGLATRDVFVDQLMEHARAQQTLGLIVVDVDGFSDFCAVNGFGAGDVALRTLGARVRSIAGPNDVAARLGDDEFGLACALRGPLEEAAEWLVERAEHLLCILRDPLTVRGEVVRLTASAGAVSAPSDFDPDTALGLADAEVRRARASGGGIVCIGTYPTNAIESIGHPARAVEV